MTTLTPFKPSISESMRARITEQLHLIESKHDVTILFAIESGSRAWGFPSPDSDYDVRFVYMHKLDWYLSLETGRDVIELPIDDELDISGWEVRKALNLMLRSNPVLLEWLHSPIKYIWREQLADPLRGLAEDAASQTPCIHHYLNLGVRYWEKANATEQRMNLKRFFYSLRPALALLWFKQNPDRTPPMNVQELAAGLSVSSEVLAEMEDLIRAKTQLKEKQHLEALPNIAQLKALMLNTFDWAQSTDKPRHVPMTTARAEEFFREIIKQSDRVRVEI
ncbi:hypothetical protein SAMN05444141_101854 [Pseudovibrio denitrificans]|uniref:Nucleotidyltransferase n=1 Tax=Pseudovibrio denitrificans TaxID=258256 RepID=A0A1I6YG44_9HYPH|nr:nucleotidyltransferase domain-containing protein [Pseudovibrio denitrificans]SFT49509.1 hypothetical protein SAMN05444141_101854 [Pseudovibrio denitrificans]